MDSLVVRERVAETYRRLGFAVVQAVPQAGILRGRGVIVSLAEGAAAGRILSADGAHCVSLEPERFDFANFTRATYPTSKMGAVALVRQTLRDALWWKDAASAYAKSPLGQTRPVLVEANAALLPAAEGRETVLFEATDALSLLRAAKIVREMKLRAIYVGAGDEYRLREQIAAAKPDLILRVDFPRPYRLDEEAEWLDVPLERLRHIDRAPSNPKWMKDAGVTFSFTTGVWRILKTSSGGSAGSRTGPLPRRRTRRRDHSSRPSARPGGSARRVGGGQDRNIVVATGEPFAPDAKVVEIWIDGKRNVLPERRKEGRFGA